MFKWAIIMMSLASLLTIFMAIPPSLRIVESMKLNEKWQGHKGGKQFNHIPQPLDLVDAEDLPNKASNGEWDPSDLFKSAFAQMNDRFERAIVSLEDHNGRHLKHGKGGKHHDEGKKNHGYGKGKGHHCALMAALRKNMTPEFLAKTAVIFKYVCLMACYVAYLTVFGLVVRAHRQLEAAKKLEENATKKNLSTEERNQVANQYQCASQKAQAKTIQQVEKVEKVERKYDGAVYQYVPPCEAPIVDDAFEKKQVYPTLEDQSLAQPRIVEERFDDEERRIHQQYVDEMNALRARNLDKQL